MSDALRERFEALVERHRGILFRTARTYRRDPEDVLDLSQEILVQLWKSFPRYDERRSFSTWMYRVALNTAISFDRRDRPRRSVGEPFEEPAAPEPTPERDDRLDALRAIIDRLDGLDRALMLLYLDDRPAREIAEVLGISETNVSTKIHRLKRRIRDEWNEREEGTWNSTT